MKLFSVISEVVFRTLVFYAGLSAEYRRYAAPMQNGHADLSDDEKRQLADDTKIIEAIKSCRFQKIDQRGLRLYDILEKLCIDLGEVMPALYSYQLADPNRETPLGIVTAAGFSNRLIMVDVRILRQFSDEEIRGVFAHEMKHFNQGRPVASKLRYFDKSLYKLWPVWLLLVIAFFFSLKSGAFLPGVFCFTIGALWILVDRARGHLAAEALRESRRNEDEADRAIAEAIPKAAVFSLVDKLRQDIDNRFKEAEKRLGTRSARKLFQDAYFGDGEYTGQDKRDRQLKEYAKELERTAARSNPKGIPEP